MRVLLGLLCVLLVLALSARAADDRTAAIVGTVHGLDPNRRAAITVHRLGGTELVERMGVQLDESVVRTLESSVDGRFEVTGLEPGVYVLFARQGVELAGETLVAVYAGSRRGAQVELRPTRTLTAVVHWADGRPVEGVARILLAGSYGWTGDGPYDPWTRTECISPSGPTFEVPLVNGTFRVVLTARRTNITIETPEGHRIGCGESWGPPEEEVSRTVPVPGSTVTGRVLDADGAPLAGATLVARQDGAGGPTLWTSTTSGPDGRFTLPVVSLPAVVSANADGHRAVSDRSFEGGDLRLETIQTTSLEGRVLHGNEPVAGAVVHVVPGARPSWMRQTREATSDAEGRYRVDGVPVGLVAVFVRGGGFASQDLATVVKRGPNPFLLALSAGEVATRDLEVERAAALVGRVLDHEGEAVAGATVRGLGVTSVRFGAEGFANDLAKSAHEGPFVATSDAEGRFEFRDLVPRHLLSLRIDAPGMPRLDAVARPAPDAQPVELRFQRPRYLTVRVVDAETKAPIAGARVGLERWRESPTTGSDGRARFGPFGDGSLRIRVHAKGYLPVIDVEPEGSEAGAGPFDVTVALARGLSITGRVFDTEGKPLAAAHLLAVHATDRRSGLSSRAATDADGRFELGELSPGTWRIDVSYTDPAARRGPRREDQRLHVELEAGTKDATLRLEAVPPGPTVALRVVDPDGKAVPRARALLLVRERRAGHADVVDGEALLVADQRAAQELAQGQGCVLVTGAADADARPLPLGAGVAGPVRGGAEVVQVTLPPAQSIAGRVRLPEGGGFAGATVRIHRPLPGVPRLFASLREEAHTDAEGSFRFSDLGPGTHVLEVDAGTRYRVAMQEAEAGARDVEIALVRCLTARLVVLGPEGRPLSGVLVRVEESTRDRQARARTRRAPEPRLPRPMRGEQRDYESAADGSVVLRGLEPGRAYDLEVYSRRDDVQDARRVDWEPAPTEIRLERGIVIAGRVVDEEGTGVEGALVQVQGREHLKGTRCAPDGRFRFVRLEPGPHTLRVARSGMMWDDPRVRTRVVTEGTEDLVVQIGPR